MSSTQDYGECNISHQLVLLISVCEKAKAYMSDKYIRMVKLFSCTGYIVWATRHESSVGTRDGRW